MQAPKIIPNYPNYCLSDNGSVYNRKTKRTIKPSKSKCVSLYGNTSKRTVSISRLLREVFPALLPVLPEQPVIDGRTTKIVPGFPDYTVTAMGKVYDRKRKCEQKPSTTGQLILVNREERTCKRVQLAQLVAEVFIAPPPGPYTRIRHLDRNKHNNRADNLRWSHKGKDITTCKCCGKVSVYLEHGVYCSTCMNSGAYKTCDYQLSFTGLDGCAIKTECLKGWEDIMVLVEQAMPKSNS